MSNDCYLTWDFSGVFFVPSDLENRDYNLAQQGLLAAADPATGAERTGEVARATSARLAAGWTQGSDGGWMPPGAAEG